MGLRVLHLKDLHLSADLKSHEQPHHSIGYGDHVTDKSDLNGTVMRTADRAAAPSNVQKQLTALATLIVRLRAEVDGLLASASARTTMATPEHAASEAAALGGHAELAFGHEAPIFDLDLGELEALAEESCSKESEPPADTDSVLESDGERCGFLPDGDQATAEQGATAIDFPAAPEPNAALGATEVVDVEAAFGAAVDDTAGDVTSDGTDGHSSTEDFVSSYEELALGKFFSDEIEPEPAQRWLINELRGSATSDPLVRRFGTDTR